MILCVLFRVLLSTAYVVINNDDADNGNHTENKDSKPSGVFDYMPGQKRRARVCYAERYRYQTNLPHSQHATDKRLLYQQTTESSNRLTRRTTRKLCYRKDDRAMRPIHGCPENFGTP